MNILIASYSTIPAILYGGTERVIWDLGNELSQMGHSITFLVNKESYCSFAKVIAIDNTKLINQQIPNDIEIVHLNFQPSETIHKPYVVTQHGNTSSPEIKLDKNTIFVSKNHAIRHGSSSFIYNGLNWNTYEKIDLNSTRKYFHFLAKAAWRLKNVTGAIKIARGANQKLKVLGGNRLNVKMGFRFTPYPSISFLRMANNEQKGKIMNLSKGLIFPVLWHEPFGLAIIESLYYGCPVFATPYGSLPELVTDDTGFLSTSQNELTKAIQSINQYSKIHCHDYAQDLFNSRLMAERYLQKYESVLNGNFLNSTEPHLLEIQKEKFLPLNK